ncbi:MAG: hypothetical protein WCC74_02105 [Minisyncoccia bacterium]
MENEELYRATSEAIDSEPLKGLGLKLIGIGAEKIVFETPGSKRKIIKVSIDEVMFALAKILGLVPKDQERYYSLSSIIAEHKIIEEDLKEVFGTEHLLRNGVFKAKIPLPKNVVIELFKNSRMGQIVTNMLDNREDDATFEVEVLVETQTKAEELSDPEKYKTRDFSTDLIISDEFRGAKDIPQALVLAEQMINERFLDNFDEDLKDVKYIEIIREILTKIIQFTKRTGQMLDIFGPNNITIFTKEDGSLDYHLPDVILPGTQSRWFINIKDDPEYNLLRHYYVFYYSIKSLGDKLGLADNLEPDDLVYFKGAGIPTSGQFPDSTER